MEKELHRVLIVISNMYGGGAQRVISRLTDVLSLDNAVTIMTFRTDSAYPLSDRISVRYFEEIEYLPFFQKLGRVGLMLYQVRRFRRLCQQLRQVKNDFRPDVTLSMLRYPNWLNAFTRGGGRRVMSERNNPRHKGRSYYWAGLISFLRADKVIFQTDAVKKMFPCLIRRKGVVVPNPVSVDCLASGSSRRIVTMGRLHPQKNHSMLIEAFALFAKTHPYHTLHIYGKSYNETDLEPVIRRLSLSGRVFLEGFQERIHPLIADAEQFVLSSDYEGVPNALLEAMMMGLPCVSTEFEGAREFFQDDKAVAFVPVKDPAALSAALARVSDDAVYRRDLAVRGKAFAEAFAVDRVILQWKDALFKR